MGEEKFMMKKPEIYLRQNIKYLREAKGLTQEEFAASIGNVSQEAVCNWEAGRREPELSSLIMIAKFFDITLDDLILLEIAPPKPPIALYVANIKFLRKKHGIKQKDMANLLGYRGKQGYNVVETGKAKVSVENLEKLADFFGVTLDELIKKDLSKEQ